jgi:hypothetical protein
VALLAGGGLCYAVPNIYELGDFKMRLCIVLAGLLTSIAVHAVPVIWTLQDVVYEAGVGFEEGSIEYGTASGSFVYDADTSVYSSVYITNSGPSNPNQPETWGYYNWWGYGFGSGSDTPPNGPSNFLMAHANPQQYPEDPPQESLVFFFNESLSNAGGQVLLTLGNSGTYDYSPGFPGDMRRAIISGSVVANVVPIPAAVWLFGSALAGLGWLRRK